MLKDPNAIVLCMAEPETEEVEIEGGVVEQAKNELPEPALVILRVIYSAIRLLRMPVSSLLRPSYF
jgi:hypothetical protein